MQKYWKALSIQERQKLALNVNTSCGYLRLVFMGHKKASHTLAKKLEIATDGVVTKELVRPDIYQGECLSGLSSGHA